MTQQHIDALNKLFLKHSTPSVKMVIKAIDDVPIEPILSEEVKESDVEIAEKIYIRIRERDLSNHTTNDWDSVVYNKHTIIEITKILKALQSSKGWSDKDMIEFGNMLSMESDGTKWEGNSINRLLTQYRERKGGK